MKKMLVALIVMAALVITLVIVMGSMSNRQSDETIRRVDRMIAEYERGR